MSTADPRTDRRLKRLHAEDLSRPVVPERRRRRTPVFLISGGILLVLVWAAPMLVATAPIRDRMLASVSEQFDGTITCQSLSLGWFSPIIARDVSVLDADGRSIAELPEIRGDRALYRLAFNQQQLGTFHLQKPEIALVIDDHTTNLEAFLRPWLDTEEESSDVVGSIEIADGHIQIDDRWAREKWDIDHLDLACRIPSRNSDAVVGELSAEIRGQNDRGKVDAEFKLGSMSAETGHILAQTEGLPLGVVESLLRRWQPELKIAGRFDSKVSCEWSHDEDDVLHRSIDGHLQASNLVVGGPWLAGDLLQLNELDMPCKAVWDGDQLEVRDASISCDFGQANYHGTLPMENGIVHALSHGQYALAGEMDLAGLARALPNTLRIREGTEIASGDVTIELICQEGPKDFEWQGRLETGSLVAYNDGRKVTWEKPIHVSFAGRQSEDGPVIDQLACESSFLELEASGTQEWLSVSASYDLDQLARELARFIDMQEIKLTGQGWSHMTWKRGARSMFTASGEVQLHNLGLVLPNARQWQEEQLVLFGEVTGLFAEREVQRVDSAVFEIKSATGQMQVELAKPVERVESQQKWPLAISMDTQLEGWLPRLEALFGAMPDYDVAGHCRAAIDATYSNEKIELESAIVKLANFSAHAPGMAIRESEANLTTEGVWNRTDSEVDVPKLIWKSPGLSLDASNVQLVSSSSSSGGSSSPQLSGRVAFAGDLARWQTWFADPAQPQNYRLSGRLAGEAQISRSGDITTANLRSAIEQLAYAGESGEPWREPHVQIVAAGKWNTKADRIDVDTIEVASNAARLKAAGRIEDMQRDRLLAFDGEMEYDLQQLQTVISRALGEGFRVAGRQRSPFHIRGPLGNAVIETDRRGVPANQVASTDQAWFHALSGETKAGWQWIDAYGFGIGAGQLNLKLADGLVRMDPIDLALSEGRLHANPIMRLSPGPALLHLPAGPLIERVRINPAMCDQALQYVAPILAGVTEAQGTFSIDLDDSNIPISEPKQAEISGRLKVHSIEVTAGPLARELATLFNRAQSVKLQRESTVPFKMVDGRIFHRDLELVFPDVTIKTHGSVGLDHTLSLVAEMPIPDKWIGNNSLGTALKNQTLELPIGGTLEKPKINEQALREASGRLIQNSAGNLLMDGVNRQLDRLLKPKP